LLAPNTFFGLKISKILGWAANPLHCWRSLQRSSGPYVDFKAAEEEKGREEGRGNEKTWAGKGRKMWEGWEENALMLGPLDPFSEYNRRNNRRDRGDWSPNS